MKIAMTVSNNVIDDIRVIKEANVLSDLGHAVYIFGNDSKKSITKLNKINVINSKWPFLKTIIKKFNFSNVQENNNIENKNKIKLKLLNILKGIILLLIIKFIQKKIYKDIKKTKIKFDFLHCHDLDTLKVGVKYKKVHKCKLVYDSHELWTEMSGINNYVKNVYSKKENKYFNSVDYLITVSPSIINELKNRYKLKIPILLLRNIPDYKFLIKPSVPNIKKIKIIYIGHFLKGRGIEQIIDNFIYFPINTELTLIIQNNKQLLEELNKKVKEKKFKTRIKIKPFFPQNKVIAEISKFDIGILPYLSLSLNNYYCLPNKLFQYLSAGLCVLSNELPDIKDILNKYKCGITYDSLEKFYKKKNKTL